MTWALAAFLGLWLFSAVACLSIAAQNIIFLGMAAWAVTLIQARRWPASPAPMGTIYLFVALALLASLGSPDQAHSLFTWRKWLLVLILPYVADALPSRRALEAVLGSLLFFSALWCLGASLVYLAKPLGFWMQGHSWAETGARWLTDIDWRAGSGSGGYQVLGTCSALLLLLFTGLALSDAQWRRPLVFVCLAALGLGLLLTLTRGAWIAALAGMVFLFAVKKPAYLIGLGLAALAVAVTFSGSPFMKRMKSVTDPNNDSNRERIYMAQAGLSLVREHPWLGVGDSLSSYEKDGQPVLGNFLTHRSAEAVAWYRSKGVADKEQGHLHSDLWQVAAMYGLPALGLLLLFFARLLALALRSAKQDGALWSGGLGLGFAAALVAWWVNGLAEYNFGSMQSSFVLWFLCGLFFASLQHKDRA